MENMMLSRTAGIMPRWITKKDNYFFMNSVCQTNTNPLDNLDDI